jgi:hypothetical protein
LWGELVCLLLWTPTPPTWTWTTGWRKPALVLVELELHASWLREMGSRSGARSLPEEYKVRIAEAVAEVMTAAAEAGVATWGDGKAVAYAHSLLLSPGAPGGGVRGT